MSDRQHSFVALLRGINVGGHHKIPMATLRSTCAGIGWDDVRTYIQSGNIVFTSSGSAKALEGDLEEAIEQQFRFSVPVVVRSASSWRRYVGGNPFSEESKRQGNWVLLALSKRRPNANAASELQRRASSEERVAKQGDAVWIHYGNGIGGSKLTPAVLDQCIGSPVTARNWRTVLKLEDLVNERNAG